MTHTDELRGRNLIREVVDTYAEPENFPRSHVSPLAESILQLIDDARADERKAVHADIAARALSDEVVEAVARKLIHHQQNTTPGLEVSEDYVWDVQFEDGRDETRAEARACITALLLELGITESENTDD